MKWPWVCWLCLGDVTAAVEVDVEKMSGLEAVVLVDREVELLEDLLRGNAVLFVNQGCELVALRGVANGVGQGKRRRRRLLLERQCLWEEVASHRRERDVCHFSL